MKKSLLFILFSVFVTFSITACSDESSSDSVQTDYGAYFGKYSIYEYAVTSVDTKIDSLLPENFIKPTSKTPEIRVNGQGDYNSFNKYLVSYTVKGSAKYMVASEKAFDAFYNGFKEYQDHYYYLSLNLDDFPTIKEDFCTKDTANNNECIAQPEKIVFKILKEQSFEINKGLGDNQGVDIIADINGGNIDLAKQENNKTQIKIKTNALSQDNLPTTYLLYNASDDKLVTLDNKEYDTTSSATETIYNQTVTNKNGTMIVRIVKKSNNSVYTITELNVLGYADKLYTSHLYKMLFAGEKNKINIKMDNEESYDKIVFKSQHENIVSVTDNGTITAKNVDKPQQTNIIAEYVNRKGETIKSISEILVLPKKEVTKIDLAKPETIAGSYNVTFFATKPQGEGFVGSMAAMGTMTTDCAKAGELGILIPVDKKTPDVKTECKKNGVLNEDIANIIGQQAVITYDEATGLTLATKLQIWKSIMSMSPDDTYQYTAYTSVPVANITDKGINVDVDTATAVKGVSGRHLTAKSENPLSTFKLAKMENGDLYVELELVDKETMVGKVKAPTYVILKKIYDYPIVDINPNRLFSENTGIETADGIYATFKETLQ